MPVTAGRSPVAWSLGAALAALAAVTVLVAAVELALFPASGLHPVWALDLFTVTGLCMPRPGWLHGGGGPAAAWV